MPGVFIEPYSSDNNNHSSSYFSGGNRDIPLEKAPEGQEGKTCRDLFGIIKS